VTWLWAWTCRDGTAHQAIPRLHQERVAGPRVVVWQCFTSGQLALSRLQRSDRQIVVVGGGHQRHAKSWLGSLAAWQGREQAMALGMTFGLCRTGSHAWQQPSLVVQTKSAGGVKLPAFHKDTPARHRTSGSWGPDWLHFSGTKKCSCSGFRCRS
jgi:hypothetical protein